MSLNGRPMLSLRNSKSVHELLRLARLAVRMFIAQRLPKFLYKCDFEWVVKQRLDGFNEAYGMRQLRVPFKRRHVSPPSMNVELVRISNGAKSAIAEAAWFVARGSLNFKHCLVHLALLTIASVESAKTNIPMIVSVEGASRAAKRPFCPMRPVHRQRPMDSAPPPIGMMPITALVSLTFDMSGSRSQAQPAGGCPLDGIEGTSPTRSG